MRNAAHSGFGSMPDQAAGLRRLLGNMPLRAIAVAGDGATTLTANVAAALGMNGLDVLMIDENANHGNLADQFGVSTRCELLHALTGERALADVISEAATGVRLLPAARGARELAILEDGSRLASCLREAPPAPDLILIDSASGGVSRLLRRSDAHCETVIVAGATHESITAAYALIKSAAQEFGESEFRVIVNRARDYAEARAIFSNMSAVARMHAGCRLELLGWMPNDAQMKLAKAARKSAIEVFPQGAVALAARGIAQRLHAGEAPDANDFAAAAAAAAVRAGELDYSQPGRTATAVF